jgi:hypothetical protein
VLPVIGNVPVGALTRTARRENSQGTVRSTRGSRPIQNVLAATLGSLLSYSGLPPP